MKDSSQNKLLNFIFQSVQDLLWKCKFIVFSVKFKDLAMVLFIIVKMCLICM